MDVEPAAMLADMPVPVAVVARDGAVTFANPPLLDLIGRRKVVGAAFDDAIGLPGAFAAVAESAAAASPREVELTCRVDGDRELVLGASSSISSSGSVVVVLREVAVSHAAGSSHTAEQTDALRLLAEFPEKNPGPVGRVTRDGTVVMANAAARTFLGRDEIRGASWIELCPGMTPELWGRILNDQRVTHEAEREGVCILFTHVVSDAGDLVFVYGADVTARREAEQLQAQQAAQLAEVARFPEMNPGPVLRMGPDAKVLMANAAARRVFGEDLLGESWLELCPGVDTVLWKQVEAADDVVFHDARIGERSYVFAHRWDARTRLMFVFGADVSAQKSAEKALRQSERMATLGTLAAGLAHELNNPAAAARRAADQLAGTFVSLQEARQQLDAAGLSPEGWAVLGELESRARSRSDASTAMGALERSDREATLEDWLLDHGVDDPWDIVSELVSLDLTDDDLARLADAVPAELLGTGLRWATAADGIHGLAREVFVAATRISEIVGAMKSYSYLGQAPIQAVDVHEGLDSTLVIMRSKLAGRIEVHRDYDPALPAVAAFGSELNQVWTNLIDNAAEAIEGPGIITIRTRREGDDVVVEVTDDGRGIPEEIQHLVFDPFFTTKEPGQGTGLGLATSYSIVTEGHRGAMTLRSRPGSTSFVVRLPIETPGDQA